MLNYFYKYISMYDVTTEVVFVALAIIMMVLFLLANPQNNYMMKMVKVGVAASLITMILHMAMLGETIRINEGHPRTAFNVLYCLHIVFYVTVICFIHMYMAYLALRRRIDNKYTKYNTSVLAIVSYAVLLYPLLADKLFTVQDGAYKLSIYFNFNAYTSILCAMASFCTIVVNRKSVATVVHIGTLALTPIVAMTAIAQIYVQTAYFLCATYILPFLIFYILFHSYRFDDVTGSQYFEALPYMLKRRISSKKEFMLLTINFPRLENLEYGDIKNQVLLAANETCRNMEHAHRGVKVYRISSYKFNILCPINSDEDFEKTSQALIKILDEYEESTFKTVRHILIARKYDEIKNAGQYIAFINHMERLFINQEYSEIRYATEDDWKRYIKSKEVENNLLDIRAKNDLDDERVLVYIQPIYSISEHKFKTGEALMRMKINDKMIFPDEFIPVAEDIECIHTLTKIMLHKVAKKTTELKTDYPDFEALTINVSTFEMDDPNVGQEFLDIITNAGADPHAIRMEITESTTITDYSRIIENMKFLVSQGVLFYLDDFGTGYSNLERITRFPFNTIKFDKSLLYRALEDKGSEELFCVLLNHFKARGFCTVIEGVEDESQKQYVEDVGFSYIQGYYFSKPLNENAVNSFFEN